MIDDGRVTTKPPKETIQALADDLKEAAKKINELSVQASQHNMVVDFDVLEQHLVQGVEPTKLLQVKVYKAL